MKKHKSQNSLLACLLLLLLFTACYEFDFVNQPYTADPDSFFDVQIDVIHTGGGDVGISYFGILLPSGWTTSDSIEYINDTTNSTGFMVYSDSLSLLMSSIDPPPANYYWWVGKDSCSAFNLETFTSEFKIYTDSQTGTFFLDYMLGDDFNGLNYQRSNDHLIIVGDTVGCFPEGITFSTQEEIDNFQTNYPNCNQIAGNITIAGNEISNLNGLNNLTSIGGSFWITDSVPLTSLGLDNLSSIGGAFSLKNNMSLINLSGMDNLMIVGGDLLLENTNLTNLMGLESLNTIGENFSVITNSTLTSLTGLDNVTHIGGSLEIESNAQLASLTGLDNITSIGGYLEIKYNENLNSFSGLENVSSIGGFMYIAHNSALADLSGFSNLTSIGGHLTINSNDNLNSLSGLDNVSSIGGYLTINQNQYLNSLSGLENMSSIGGYLEIYNNYTLSSLTGLNNVSSIGGYLDINQNQYLNSLSGLENVSSIGGYLGISNNYTLSSLTGLNNVSSIGGYLEINNNPNLNSLSALENVSSIGGKLSIYGNGLLTSLVGLENIDAGSIENLEVLYNNSLSTCDIQSICNYLASPNGTVTIENNAYGCHSQEAVEDACEDNCLPDGITFTTQEQIDSFQFNHPGCSWIYGDVMINGTDIQNLNGLNVIIAFGGTLEIVGNDSLSNLTGLDNVTSIGGSLSIDGNNTLASLSELENLTSIGESFMISGNDALTCLTELENLTSIGGSLTICDNDVLFSLAGLDYIDPGTVTDLSFTFNNSLSTCNVQNICDYLSSPNGTIEISDNAYGCNSLTEVILACENHCLPNGITFSTQQDINDFQANHPACSVIEGDVKISGSDISSLTGLNVLTAIGGNLEIWDNDSLTSLAGLENLTSINGNLSIGRKISYYYLGNLSLTSLSGLDSLSFIGGDLDILSNNALESLISLTSLSEVEGNLRISFNQELNDLSGLEHLTSIGGDLDISDNIALVALIVPGQLTSLGGDLYIYKNPALVSLTGLDSIEEGSIMNLSITDNFSLADCAVQSICEYLNNPAGTVEIHNNATGCNSQQQVQVACDGVSVDELNIGNAFTISPNPCSGTTHLEISNIKQQTIKLEVFTISGVKIKELLNEEMTPGIHEIEVDLRDLPARIYYCVLRTNAGNYTTKLIKI